MFNKVRGGATDTILVYVDDLLLTLSSKAQLDTVADALRVRYGGVIVKSGLEHDFLGINWKFGSPGEVS